MKHVLPIIHDSQTLRKFAVWKDGHCSWLSSKEWNISPSVTQGISLSILAAYHSKWNLHVTILHEYLDCEKELMYTFIIHNESEQRTECKLVYYEQTIGEIEPTVAFVSPVEQAISYYGNNGFKLLATKFQPDQTSQLAVGSKQVIWDEQIGNLALSPLSRKCEDSMVVTNIRLEPLAESYGRIWNIQGKSEKEVYKKYKKLVANDQLDTATDQLL